MKDLQANNKLFLVCPFCRIEEDIREAFGDVNFITAPASIFNLNDISVARELRYLIMMENVTGLYVVCDEGCDILNAALWGQPHGLHCDDVLKDLIDMNDDACSLAGKVVRHQLDALIKSRVISVVLHNGNISLHGLILAKNRNIELAAPIHIY